MLEKPYIKDSLIISQLQNEYGLSVAQLRFLPLGADKDAAVYSAVAQDKKVYFLKLRKSFNRIAVTVPAFLTAQGVKEIIAPLESKSQQRWADFGEYTMILYPFVEGNNRFEMPLSDLQKQTLGRAFKAIHSAKIPAELKESIPKESFSGRSRESMRAFLAQVDNQDFSEAVAIKLATFIKSKRQEIRHLIDSAEALALELQSQALEFVLCHTDIHGGNILISDDNKLYIVDWDSPLLAPKERDLMFIGGGIDQIWQKQSDEALFYQGYGETKINLAALAYYRYERIIVDLVEFCQQLLLTDEGGADREEAYRWFTYNFEPGRTIDRARSVLEN